MQPAKMHGITRGLLHREDEKIGQQERVHPFQDLGLLEELDPLRKLMERRDDLEGTAVIGHVFDVQARRNGLRNQRDKIAHDLLLILEFEKLFGQAGPQGLLEQVVRVIDVGNGGEDAGQLRVRNPGIGRCGDLLERRDDAVDKKTKLLDKPKLGLEYLIKSMRTN